MRKKIHGDLNNLYIIFLEFNKIIEIHEVGPHKKGVMIAGYGKGETFLEGYTCQKILSFSFFQTLLFSFITMFLTKNLETLTTKH